MGNSPHNNANSKKRWRRNGCSNLGVRLSFVLVVTVTCSVNTAHAGSRLIEPPSRPSLWRYGFGTAVNFNDDEVMCGGYDRQYGQNGGRCGVCGDPWDEAPPRKYEAGSVTTPSPRPVRVYRMGGDIPVAVESTSDLAGRYEFRLCKVDRSSVTPGQDCFDRTPLAIRESELGQSYRIGQSGGLLSLHLVLPDRLTCAHCILQWRHVTGNRVNKESCVQCGTAAPKCNYCLGCGQQAWYQSCSDIAVIDTMGSHPAVQGVRTQQELKEKWEQTLKDLKGNCSCGGGTMVKPSDNSINTSYPLSESTTSALTTHGQGTVTPAPQGVRSGSSSQSHHKPPTTNLQPPARPPHSSQPKPPRPGTNSKPRPGTNSKPRPGTNSKPRPGTNSKPASPGGSVRPKPWSPSDGFLFDRPLFNTNWKLHANAGTRTKRPPSTNRNPSRWTPRPPQHATGNGRCYVPFRPPWYMQHNARQWCARNCPRSGAPCGYRVCRPVTCRTRTRRRPTPSQFNWLLPLLLMEGFEL